MIIISPYAKYLRNGGTNPKNYTRWYELMPLIRCAFSDIIIQVGVNGEPKLPLVDEVQQNLPFDKLAVLVKECRTWISVDSFFQHFCWDLGKPGVVLFSRSDPNIFGHPENTNLLVDRKYLREKQFWMWEQDIIVPQAYVDPTVVVEALKKFE